MDIRSLGYRTDLAVLALEGSEVTDQGDHIVVRTPGNPDYWWGNFLLIPGVGPGSGQAWADRLAAEFPAARHLALGLDETDPAQVRAGELPGLDFGRNVVLTAAAVHAPPRPNTEAVFRVLDGDADWRQSLALTTAVYGGDPVFTGRRQAAKRALTEAGHGAWWGAFLDGTLVTQLGLVPVQGGLARYQDVETHPAARRRGLAGTLVWQAGAAALAAGAATLVMVADPEDEAIRVYRTAGFTETEDQLRLIRPPARERA